MKRQLLTLIALLTCTLLVQAQQSDSLRILWIGNSYTYVNDLPTKVTQLAGEQGLKLAPTRFLKGGARLMDHFNNRKVIQALKQGGWDYIVLQEQSSNPAQSTRDVINDTYFYAHLLCNLAKENSTKAHIIFYMTWGHRDGNMQEHDQIDPSYPLDATYEDFQSRLRTTYLEMTYENKVWCSPVGMAWQNIRKEHPEINLYAKDGSHPSPEGTYLAAQCFLATILQKAYTSTNTLGIDKKEAILLQQTAQKIVEENKKLLKY